MTRQMHPAFRASWFLRHRINCPVYTLPAALHGVVGFLYISKLFVVLIHSRYELNILMIATGFSGIITVTTIVVFFTAGWAS